MADLQTQTAVNIQEKSNLIWAIADIIRDHYKAYEYGKVILPMTVIKRFNDTLAPTKEKVLEAYEKYKDYEKIDIFLTKESGYNFYNISKYDFKKLCDDPNHIDKNFRNYLDGFSENVRDIISNFKFDDQITTLSNSGLLYHVINEFNKPDAYMGADKITAVDMGYIFEELIRKFSESHNEEAGQFFTSRDIIYLMTDLLIAEDKDRLIKEGVAKTVYDMAMGTSQMLTCMTERLVQLDPNADVRVFGQELNYETYAIAKSDILIRGGNPDNMCKDSTLSKDGFKGYKFDYIISNPPFGTTWKADREEVVKEHHLGDKGRFAPELPSISDGQMLFDLNGIAKLKDSGKMAIVHNGSSLFSGGPDSGNSEIRRYIIEHDWLDAIVQLPTDLFYNTNITTYIWLISKSKPEYRQGKVQLIDASSMAEPIRKNIGNKRNNITDECRETIIKAYCDYKNNARYELNGKLCESKIFSNQYFGYRKVQIDIPQSDDNVIKQDNSHVADKTKKTYEVIPLVEDIDEYFEREIKPYSPNACLCKNDIAIGYEIPFTRLFYKYTVPESSETIKKRILTQEKEIAESLNSIFRED